MPTLIKRYANRKLYNTETSRYITLKGIAELLDQGATVQVIDNETGEDITSVALSQILVDSERANSDVSQNLLSQILERGGDALYTALKRSVDDATEGLEDLQDRVRRIVHFGEQEARDSEHEGEAHPKATPEATAKGESREGGPSAERSRSKKSHSKPGRRMSDWIAFSSPDFDHILQTSVERVFKLLDLPRRSDIAELNANLERVAKAIECLGVPDATGEAPAGKYAGEDGEGSE